MAKAKRKITDDLELYVICNTTGDLYFKNNDLQEWTWSSIGEEHILTVKDIKLMKSAHSRFLKDKWIKFHDEDSDILEYLRISHFFGVDDNFVDIDDLLRKDIRDIESFLQSYEGKPSYNNIASQVAIAAKEHYKSGNLTNTHIIEFLEKKLNITVKEDNEE